jgi:hypothetical protein
MYLIKTILAALLVMLLFTGCATKNTVAVADFSGYVGDYEGLEKTTDELGHEVLRWQSPDLIPGAYDLLMIDPIVFYPEPKPSPQVSEQVLMEIQEYSNAISLHEVNKVGPVTSQPGANVLRMRLAITGISTAAEGLKGFEYIPLAAIAAGVTSASGNRNRETFMVTETELVDSITGERMFM